MSEPVNEPVRGEIEVNGARICYFERGARRPDQPTLFFVHATGFHARVWDYQCEALAGYHSIAIDQRGHGRSSKLAVQHWRTFGEDQAAFVQALDLQGLIGVGHSMGGHGLVEAASISGRFDRLLLLDPTISEPANYIQSTVPPFGEGLHPAAKRRRNFDSVQDMIDNLGRKSSFPLFHSRIFRDYCQYGLEPDGEGFRLCCEPEVEARVYMAAMSNGEIFESVRNLMIPVTIIRAHRPDDISMMDFSTSPTWPGLVDEFPNAVEQHWDDCTHFIPMQRPDEVVAVIREEIAAWS